MKSIDNTLELIALGAALTSAVSNSREDGKLNAADLVHLIGVFPLIGPALDGVEEVPAELRDLDEAELGLVLERVRGIVGNYGDEKIVEYAEVALTIGLAVFKAVEVARS